MRRSAESELPWQSLQPTSAVGGGRTRRRPSAGSRGSGRSPGRRRRRSTSCWRRGRRSRARPSARPARVKPPQPSSWPRPQPPQAAALPGLRQELGGPVGVRDDGQHGVEAAVRDVDAGVDHVDVRHVVDAAGRRRPPRSSGRSPSGRSPPGAGGRRARGGPGVARSVIGAGLLQPGLGAARPGGSRPRSCGGACRRRGGARECPSSP